jgi:hypothetical protein
VIFAKKLRSTSFEIGVFLRFALRTPNLDGWSGSGIYINWSKRPYVKLIFTGLNKA